MYENPELKVGFKVYYLKAQVLSKYWARPALKQSSSKQEDAPSSKSTEDSDVSAQIWNINILIKSNESKKGSGCSTHCFLGILIRFIIVFKMFSWGWWWYFEAIRWAKAYHHIERVCPLCSKSAGRADQGSLHYKHVQWTNNLCRSTISASYRHSLSGSKKAHPSRESKVNIRFHARILQNKYVCVDPLKQTCI